MKILGLKGESLAVRFLKSEGYKILSKNFRTPVGEIDIIAQDGETVVFIEVKARTNDSFGYPFESVHKKKQKKLRDLALLYLKKQGKELPVRFDVLSIMFTESGRREIQHIKDAFEV